MVKSLHLPFYEWCIVLLFCFILLALAGFAVGGRKHVPIPVQSETLLTELQVEITGEIAHPGFYVLPLKTTYRTFIEQAKPLSTADLSQIKWRRQLRNGQSIHIPQKHSITIQISGAVQQPGSLTILSGTRIQELIDQLQVLPNADLTSLRSRKSFLKDGDILEIPFKKDKLKALKRKISCE